MKSTLQYPREQILEVLRTLEELVVSLDRIGTHANDQTTTEYHATLEAFIAKHEILSKTAAARRILSDPFSMELGKDGMDELEREMSEVSYWTSQEKIKF